MLSRFTCRQLSNTFKRNFATLQPAILNRDMGSNQWYLHLSRKEGHNVENIKKVLGEFREVCAKEDINLVVGMGPSFLYDTLGSASVPEDFQNYETFKSIDGSGKEAKGTQEDLLIWVNHNDKGRVWKAQYDLRQALENDMKLARETFTFIYGDSLDMTGFTDGTGNPEAHRDTEVAAVPNGKNGAGGSFIIAQRWVHDLKGFNSLRLNEQENVFGRTKEGSVRMHTQPPQSHLSHVELTTNGVGDHEKYPKRDEITRRSTPYAFHDGTVGLYFIGFCATQAPLRERMQRMYGMNGEQRDALTDYSNPASGSFYFAPSVEALQSL